MLEPARVSTLFLGEMGQTTNEVQPVGRWGYHFTKKDEERFWKQVDRTTTPDGCWLWIGYSSNGYGQIRINGRTRVATHFALEFAGFIIPSEGLQVRHYVCDNPPCVRPSHLKIGTKQDNADDMTRKGRQALGERLSQDRRGEHNGRAKLDPAKIQEIRRAYAAGGISQRTLGRRFGVSHTTIQCILRGDTWEDSDYGGYQALGCNAIGVPR